MRLVASTSLSAAMAASQALLRIGSTSAVANIVNVAYESQFQNQTNELHSIEEECSFTASVSLRGGDADTGILSSCSNPEHVCVEDVSSSRGGRCALVVSEKRRLQTGACETKCTPDSACEGLSQDFIDNNIGERSCCGEYACVGVSGSYRSSV